VNKIETKICTKCGDEFSATLEFFHRSKGKLASACKICINGKNKENCERDRRKRQKWYQKHKNEISKKGKIRRNSVKNKKFKKEYDKKYNKENKDKINKRSKIYRKNNKQKAAAQNKKWRNNNKDKESIRSKKYYRKNKNKINTYLKNRKKLKIAGGKGITSIEWANKILEYDGKCAYCSVVLEKNILNVYNPNGISEDHIIAISNGGKHEISNLVPCCRKCNDEKSNKKGKEFNEWLKEKERA